MNLTPFLIFKIGKQIIFKEPLQSLKSFNNMSHISNPIPNKNLYNQNNSFSNPSFNNNSNYPINNMQRNKNKYENVEILPKFLAKSTNIEESKESLNKLMKKKGIFTKMMETYFSNREEYFANSIQDIENEINQERNNSMKAKNRDFESVKKLLAFINDNRTSPNLTLMKDMGLDEFANLTNDKRNLILEGIKQNQELLSQKLNLKFMRSPNDNNNNNNNNKNNNVKNINYNNKNNNNIYNNNYNPNNYNPNKYNNIYNNYNPNQNYNNDYLRNEANYAYNYDNNPYIVNRRHVKVNSAYNNLGLVPKGPSITNNQIDLFKIFVGNSKLSDKEVLSYFDRGNPKVTFAAERYFQKIYGKDNLLLKFNYIYLPKVGVRMHQFNFSSDVNDLFMVAHDDIMSFKDIKLFLENGKEIINDRKIKCLGALGIPYNSTINIK